MALAAALLFNSGIPGGIELNLSRIINVMESRKDNLTSTGALITSKDQKLCIKIRTYSDTIVHDLIFNKNHIFLSIMATTTSRSGNPYHLTTS